MMMAARIVSEAEWDAFLSRYPDAHLLQSSAWGKLKSDFGWEAVRVVSDTGATGAQVLLRSLPLGLHWAYIPKGPVSSNGSHESWSELWPAIDAICRAQKTIFLKVEPDRWEEDAPSDASPAAPLAGFHTSPHSIQPTRTLIVDLTGEEEDVLNRMKQKTRYNIRLALKKGVVVRSSADLETFHRLMTTTGERDDFGVHSLAYYRRAYELFSPCGECELLLAEFEGEPLAGLMVFARGRRAWYFYGASGNQHRERMPTYLLHWEAIRWARQRGCTEYDLWGVPDTDEATLESNFTQRTGGLWGVYRHKRGFGGRLLRAVNPLDRVYQPLLYRLYLWAAARRGGSPAQ